MTRYKIDFDSLVICGQDFSRHEKTVRGPFKTIAKLANNGWSSRAEILAHVTSCGKVWHEVKFRTIKEAKAAFETLKSKKGAMTSAEYLRRCRGQYN